MEGNFQLIPVIDYKSECFQTFSTLCTYNSSFSTPLHHASYGGNVEVVKLLIELGSDVNARASDKVDEDENDYYNEMMSSM